MQINLRKSLQTIASISLLITSVIAAKAADSKLESEPEVWVDILPPADLKGWYRVPVPPTGQLGREQWHVDSEKELLICDGDGGHDMLLFDKEFGDAIFHLEFRYMKIEGKTGYNSGAYVRNSKDGAIWHQAQFGDAKDGFLFGQTAGADDKRKSFNLSKQVTDMRVKPAGEWNTLELTARGKVLTLWVNSAVTCQFPDCGREKGFIGLEGEGYRIEFRNLKVKELVAPDRAQEPTTAIPADWRDTVTDAAQLPVEQNAWGTLQWVCNEKLMLGSAQTVGLATILPGKQNPVHYHPNCEEVLHVLSGQGWQSYDGRTILLKPGMTIRIPAKVKHNMVNTGTESLRTVISFSSGDRKTVFLEEQPAK